MLIVSLPRSNHPYSAFFDKHSLFGWNQNMSLSHYFYFFLIVTFAAGLILERAVSFLSLVEVKGWTWELINLSQGYVIDQKTPALAEFRECIKCKFVGKLESYSALSVPGWWCSNLINPLHPNISMQTLHTMLYTFLRVLTRRICLTITSFLSCWSFHLFS